MLRRIVASTSFAPVLFWAISLSVFLIQGWDIIAAGAHLPWDASWYGRIVQEGYRFDGDYSAQQTVAFFPLHPGVVWVVHRLLGVSVGVAELVACATMTLAACLLFHRTLKHLLGEPVATMTVGLWVANPFAIYLFNGYSEAALVLCLAAFFWFLLVRPRMHWVVFAIIAASLARPYGIFLSLVFFLYVLHAWWRSGWDHSWRTVLLVHVPLTFTGYLGWALYCQLRFGDPLATLHATQAWTGAGMPLTVSGFLTLQAPLESVRGLFTGNTVLDPVATGAMLFFGGLLLFLAFARRFPLVLVLFGLLMPLLVLPVVGQRGGIMNAGRYELPYIVHFAALAMLLVGFDRRIVRADPLGDDTKPSIPLVFYPVYLLFLAAFARYASYIFNGIWVS
jgi:hypothetical protein